MPAPSYSHGTSETPLLGDTIGENFAAHGGAVRRPPGARQPAAGRAPDLRGARRGDRRARPRGCCAPGSRRRPRRDLGAELRRVGARAVRDGEGRRDPRQRQPRLPHARARVRAAPVGRAAAVQRQRVQDQRLRRDDRRGSGAVDRLERDGLRRPPEWDEFGAASPTARRSPSDGELSFDDPINIQYTSGTTASRRARRSRTTTSSTTASSSPSCSTDRETATCLPVPFYHCFGMVMGNLGDTRARRLHGHPRAGVRSARDARGGGGGGRHLALRRADDVHRHARATGLRLVDLVAAHRDHGRLAVPDRGDEARWSTRCTWTRWPSATA